MSADCKRLYADITFRAIGGRGVRGAKRQRRRHRRRSETRSTPPGDAGRDATDRRTALRYDRTVMGGWLCEQKGHCETRQRGAWRYRGRTFALPREKGQARCARFFGICRKTTRRAGAIADGWRYTWHGGSAGSEPAIKPERSETKDWLAKVGP